MSEASMFIFINLGCEMLYVIDQRLRAQEVECDKSSQVINDITIVLLNPKCINKILNESSKTLISQLNFKKILHDAACCSLMRLEESSMSKLWDLMLMIFKWQVFASKYPQNLIDITFRHLDGISKIYPDVQKTILIDYTKDILLDHWNKMDEFKQIYIYNATKEWLRNFNVKISILLRLGFQNNSGNFINDGSESYIKDFIENIGENIYQKSKEIVKVKKEETQHNKWNDFANELNIIPLAKRQNITDIYSTFLEELTTEELTDDENFDDENQIEDRKFVQISSLHNAESSWKNFVGKDKNNLSTMKLKTFLHDSSKK